MIYDKGSKNIQCRKDNLFKIRAGKMAVTCKAMKLEYFLTPYIKITSTWIKDLNVRPDTLKLLEKNIGRMALLHKP